MNYFEESLKLSEEKQGEILVISKVKVKARDNLRFSYTLEVAEKFMKTKKTYTMF